MFKVGDLVRYGSPRFKVKCTAEVFEIERLVRDAKVADTAFVRLIHRLPEYEVGFSNLEIGNHIYLSIANLVKINLNLNRYKKLKHCLEIRNLAL